VKQACVGDKVDEEPAAATFAADDKELAAANALATNNEELAAATTFDNNNEELAAALANHDEELAATTALAATKNTRAVSKKITLKVFKNKVEKV
jgi:hypothetical protein